jgi:hypothetical protein
MPKYTTISQSEFDTKARLAIALQPIRKEVSLKNIEVVGANILKVEDQLIPMSDQAFKDTCKAVGLPVSFDKSFTNSFGDKARQQLINRLKIAKSAKGTTTVSLVVSPETKTILGVHKSAKDLISNDAFVKSASQIIDRYDLQVNNFSVSREGELVINTSSPKNHWEVSGLNNEQFFGGVSFGNDSKNGYQVSPYLERLVCANGMIGRAFEETLKLESFSAMAMEAFFNEMERLAKSGFKPSMFDEKVKRAIDTRASLFEMETIHSAMRDLAKTEYKELEAWVPLESTRAKYHLAGIDTVTMSKEQKRNAKTGTSVWDLLNGLTHFSTHDNGFAITDDSRRRLQVQAGGLLVKEFDMSNLVTSPF